MNIPTLAVGADNVAAIYVRCGVVCRNGMRNVAGVVQHDATDNLTPIILVASLVLVIGLSVWLLGGPSECCQTKRKPQNDL